MKHPHQQRHDEPRQNGNHEQVEDDPEERLVQSRPHSLVFAARGL